MPHIQCPLCEQSKKEQKTNLLYGKPVCKKCYNGFANRRQGAFIIDIILFRIATTFVEVLLFLAIVGENIQQPDKLNTYISASWGLTFLMMFLLTLKDGFAGHSLGKLITGVQVVDDTSKQPGGYLHSIKRNLPILIPIVPLVIAVQLMKGKRLGDGWANSRTIWKKYRDNPVFTGAELQDPSDEFLPGVPRPDLPKSTNPFSAPIE